MPKLTLKGTPYGYWSGSETTYNRNTDVSIDDVGQYDWIKITTSPLTVQIWDSEEIELQQSFSLIAKGGTVNIPMAPWHHQMGTHDREIATTSVSNTLYSLTDTLYSSNYIKGKEIAYQNKAYYYIGDYTIPFGCTNILISNFSNDNSFDSDILWREVGGNITFVRDRMPSNAANKVFSVYIGSIGSNWNWNTILHNNTKWDIEYQINSINPRLFTYAQLEDLHSETAYPQYNFIKKYWKVTEDHDEQFLGYEKYDGSPISQDDWDEFDLNKSALLMWNSNSYLLDKQEILDRNNTMIYWKSIQNPFSPTTAIDNGQNYINQSYWPQYQINSSEGNYNGPYALNTYGDNDVLSKKSWDNSDNKYYGIIEDNKQYKTNDFYQIPRLYYMGYYHSENYPRTLQDKITVVQENRVSSYNYPVYCVEIPYNNLEVDPNGSENTTDLKSTKYAYLAQANPQYYYYTQNAVKNSWDNGYIPGLTIISKNLHQTVNNYNVNISTFLPYFTPGWICKDNYPLPWEDSKIEYINERIELYTDYIWNDSYSHHTYSLPLQVFEPLITPDYFLDSSYREGRTWTNYEDSHNYRGFKWEINLPFSCEQSLPSTDIFEYTMHAGGSTYHYIYPITYLNFDTTSQNNLFYNNSDPTQNIFNEVNNLISKLNTSNFFTYTYWLAPNNKKYIQMNEFNMSVKETNDYMSIFFSPKPCVDNFYVNRNGNTLSYKLHTNDYYRFYINNDRETSESGDINIPENGVITLTIRMFTGRVDISGNPIYETIWTKEYQYESEN